jgi:hypothetical protein
LVVDGIAGKRTIAAAEKFTRFRGVRAINAILQMVLYDQGADIVIDGINGSKTRRAFDAIYHKDQPLAASWFTFQQLLPHLNRASTTFRIQPGMLQKLLEKEAGRRTTKKGVEYNAAAISPTGNHRGLLQLSPDAWDDATRYAVKFGVSLPDYWTSWNDPGWSITAGAAYLQWSFDTATKKYGSLPPTFEVKYALYNQGYGFAKKLKTNVTYLGHQSADAIASHEEARRQVLES